MKPKRRRGGPEVAVSADMACGFGPFKFAWMQSCRTMGCFVGVYSLSAIMTSILTIYIVSQITTIEKQYGLSSAQSGMLLSCNDIGYLLTAVVASYFARRVNIPRVISGTVILFGVAGLICSLPYFVSKDMAVERAQRLIDQVTISEAGTNTSLQNTRPAAGALQSPVCNLKHSPGAPVDLTYSGSSDVNMTISVGDHGNSTACKTERYGIGEPNQFTNVAMALIAIGMVIQGVAKAPRYPFISTYVDDNVKKKNTAMYMGILSGVGIFGPAIAFGLGGVFSQTYVTLQDVPIGPRHPAWLGAWWLGFVVFGLVAILVAIPLSCFPKRIRAKPVKKNTAGLLVNTRGFMGLLKTLLRLFSNPVYTLICVANCFVLFGVAGSIAFSAKYLETQFFIPAWKANMLLGATNIMAGAAGTVGGGFFVSKRRLSPLACVKMLLIVGASGLVQNVMLFVLGCPNAEISGLTTESIYPGTNGTCAAMCDCDSRTYFPVCGSDNNNYMSPCHAGCQTQENLMFGDCSCIGPNSTATPGLCESDCKMLYPYLINSIVGSFLGTLGIMPAFIINIRSVSEEDKSMAVGVFSLLISVFGWFLAPIIFGLAIDTACLVWGGATCFSQGACALYDNDAFRYRMASLQIASQIMFVLFVLFVFFKARRKTDWSLEENVRDCEDDVELSVAMINKSEDTKTQT